MYPSCLDGRVCILAFAKVLRMTWDSTVKGIQTPLPRYALTEQSSEAFL